MKTKRLLSIGLIILSLGYFTSYDEIFNKRIEDKDINTDIRLWKYSYLWNY